MYTSVAWLMIGVPVRHHLLACMHSELPSAAFDALGAWAALATTSGTARAAGLDWHGYEEEAAHLRCASRKTAFWAARVHWFLIWCASSRMHLHAQPHLPLLPFVNCTACNQGHA